MLKRKLTALVLSAVMVTGVLAGCSNKGGNTTPTTGGDTKTTGEKTKITFWKWIPTEADNQMPALEKAFETANPDIDLEVTHVGESNAYFQKLSAALPAGEGPDVVAMQVGANANQYKEFLEPLAPWAEKKWGTDWKNKFLDVALNQCAISGDDFVVLPGGMTAVPIIEYNATTFKKYGLTPPKTLDDLKNIIKTLKEKDSSIVPGLGMGAKDGWNNRDAFMGIVNQVAPKKIYDAEAGKIAWTDADIVKSLEIWKSLFDTGIYTEGALGMSPYPDVLDGFTSHKIAMFSIGTWHLSGMTKVAHEQDVKAGTKKEDDHWGFFMYPPVVEGGTPALAATVDIAWAMNANTDEKKKEAVWKFLDFMTVGEGQKIFANTLQVLPSAKNIDMSEALNGAAGDVEKEAIEMAMKAVENNIGNRELRYPELQNALQDNLQAVAAGSKTPQKAAEDIDKVSKSIQR